VDGGEDLIGVFLRFAEEDEVVGVADEAAAELAHGGIEVGEEQVGEDGGEGRALGDALAEGTDAVAVPDVGADPGVDEGVEFAGGFAFGVFSEEEGVVDVVEVAGDIGFDDEGVAAVAPLLEAGDGGVDAFTGAVAEADVEEIFFEGAGEAAGDGGLEDAVADGGDEEETGAGVAGLLFELDLEEGEGTVFVGGELGEELGEFAVEAGGEAREGDAVGTGASGVFEDALPGIE